jgi:phage I-like protein
MIGQWVKDLFAVRAALTKKSVKSRIGLLAFEEAAVAALAAAALEKKFYSVKVERLLSSYVITGSPLTQRYSIYLPGILQWGDISLLAALANCPLEVASLSLPSGKALTPKQRTAWLCEVQEMAKRLGIRSSVT